MVGPRRDVKRNCFPIVRNQPTLTDDGSIER